MYLVAVTTSIITDDTTYVYLHGFDRRLQLSPWIDREVMIPTLYDARHALYAAKDFYDEGDLIARYITLTGPDGLVQSSYRGPNDDVWRLGLAARHDAALSAAGILHTPRPATL